MGVLKVAIFLLFTLLYTNANPVGDGVNGKNLTEKVLIVSTTENVNKIGTSDSVINGFPDNTTSTVQPTTPPTTSTPVPTSSTTTTTTPSTSTTTPSTPTTTVPSNTTTTVQPTSSSTTTTVPPTTTKAPPPKPNHRFDFPSFIGGVIFTLGLIAIGFLLHKFYKARTDRNYHTL